jgi:hypothetical protein
VLVIDGKSRRESGVTWGNRGDRWALKADFLAYADDPNFRGGIFVDVGKYNGDAFEDILVGPGGGGARIQVFDGARVAAGKSTPELNENTLANFIALSKANTTDPLFGTSTAVRGVGGVAFGSVLSGGSGERSILVATGRGPTSRIEEYVGVPGQEPELVDGENDKLLRRTRRDGNLLTDPFFIGDPNDPTNTSNGRPIRFPVSGPFANQVIPLDRLNYGGTVGGFAPPPDQFDVPDEDDCDIKGPNGE